MESRRGFIPALRFLSVLVPQSAQCCAVSTGRVQFQTVVVVYMKIRRRNS